MTAVEAGIKTFLIADVRGYTRFTSERGDEAAARLATRFAELAREAIEAAGGTLVELRGDEALAVFDSARQALRAAADLQERFVMETVADPSLPLAVGIGLDAGEAVPVDGGYRGGALNLAARLCSIAAPGEVLVSPGVAHLARKVEGLDYVERGAVRVKGLEKPVEVVAVRPEREDVARDLAFRRALDPALAGGVKTRSPYKGLRAFAEDDAGDFFGRESLTEHLVERLAETRFLAVVGPSGSGKSSVVRAGLVPRIREGALPGSERWHVVEMFPGAYPLEELEAALLRTADSSPAGLLEQLEQDERGLLRAVKRLLADDASELVLVVDQLEELFTLVEDEARRMQFLALLERAVLDPHARLRVVVTLRADFYDRPLLYSGFAELLRDYVEAVVPLRPEEFERAIAGPAERVGARFEPGLLAELVADVADEPGALPLLQYALTELYERREGSTLTAAAYRAIGGISGALAGRAEEIYGGLGEHAQEAARQLFLRLVTLGEGAEDTRRRVERTELASMEVDQSALEQAIQEFGAWRLLSFDRDPRSGTPTIEVAHEALMREWARFRRWIDSGREQVRLHRRLATAAREWEGADREPSYLLRGSNLAQFELLAGESTIALTELEREFVEASTAANELELARQRRQNRRLKALLSGALALLVLAILAGALALQSRSKARHEAKVALGRQLGAEAVSEPRIDLAMLLARESLNLDRSLQTEGALLATLLRDPATVGTFTTPIVQRPQSVEVAPDGGTIAVVTNGGGGVGANQANPNEMHFYDTHTHRQVRALALSLLYTYLPGSGDLVAGAGSHPYMERIDSRTYRPSTKFDFDRRWLKTPTSFPQLMVTPDHRWLEFAYAVIDADGSEGPVYLDRWPLARGGKPTTVALGLRGMAAAVITPADRLVIGGDGVVTTWKEATLRKVASVRVPGLRRLGNGPAAISPDGKLLAYGLSNGTVHFVDLATGKETAGLAAHAAAVQRVAFSPDSRTVATSGDDGLVILWDPRTGQPLERLTGHTGPVPGLAFTGDGTTLYAAGLDGTVLQWQLDGSRRFGTPFRIPGLGVVYQTGVPDAPPMPPLAISPDGRSFATRRGLSSVGIYSTSTLRLQAAIRLGNRAVVGDVAWSGRTLVVGASDGGVGVYSAGARPRLVRRLTGLHRFVRGVATADGGSLVAAVDGRIVKGQETGALAIWRNGRLVAKPRQLYAYGWEVAFSHDGSMLAVAEDNHVQIVDPRTGRIERTIPMGLGSISVGFSHDGTIASGSFDGIVTRWDPRSGRQIGHATLAAPAPVSSIAFDPSGETFVTTGGSSGHAKLWSAATQQQLGVDFPGGEGSWGNAGFTPDGRYLIVLYGDGTAYRWPATPAAWAAHACAVAGRNFTHEEWQRFVGSRSYSRVCPQFPPGR